MPTNCHWLRAQAPGSRQAGVGDARRRSTATATAWSTDDHHYGVKRSGAFTMVDLNHQAGISVPLTVDVMFQICTLRQAQAHSPGCSPGMSRTARADS